jgi:hypothetical protein
MSKIRHFVIQSFVALMLVMCGATDLPVQAQQRFASPEAGVDALLAAARIGDVKRINAILGPDGRSIVSSGDPVSDKKTRDNFVANYDARHQIAYNNASKVELLVGQMEWPMPIPLVKKSGSWQFDAAAGRVEILARRIGRNELDAIETCLAYVDAQNEYASINPERNGAYARRIISRPGMRDGLFWPTAEGEQASPLGFTFANATAEGYRLGKGRIPYHGYYYSILTNQGPNASGGRADYIVKGNMIGGFALVAYPAVYLNSGVMTFIVNHEGNVFQKNLGMQTTKIAEHMSAFDPNSSWQQVQTMDVQ